ncbi:MAG: hypothetical protein Kow0069_31530 [Promethearchaeota archaeon]
MTLSLADVVGLFIALFFGINLVVLTLRMVRTRRPAPSLAASLGFGTLGGLMAILGSQNAFPGLAHLDRVLLATQLSFYGLQFFFFFVFLEHLNARRLSTSKVAVALALVLLQNFSLWGIVGFEPYSEVTAWLWLFADVGYNTLALFVFVVVGVPLYVKAYRYSREGKALLLGVALLVVGAGYVEMSLLDYVGFAKDYFPSLTAAFDAVESVRDLGEVLPLAGLVIFTLVYVSDVSYVYRLPFDVPLLLVAYKSGEVIFSRHFQTKRELRVNDLLFSGMISAINNVFSEIFRERGESSSLGIQEISSKDVQVFIEEGELVTVVVVTGVVSHFLARATRSFREDFEARFGYDIKTGTAEVSKFASAADLIPGSFPFFRFEGK